MMKYLKLLAFAAIAAVVLTAFLEPGAAPGAVLCEETPASGTDCAGPSVVAKGTNLVFSAEGSTALTGPFGEIIATCTESTVEGGIANAGSTTESVSGNISKLTFTNCGTRTVTANSSTLGTLTVSHIAGTDNGTVRSSDTTVTITNTPFGTCRYLTANTDIGTLTGTAKTSGAPTFDISATIPAETEFCPNGTWEGSYKYTGGTNFYVAMG
jgi:hypothetical protein